MTSVAGAREAVFGRGREGLAIGSFSGGGEGVRDGRSLASGRLFTGSWLASAPQSRRNACSIRAAAGNGSSSVAGRVYHLVEEGDTLFSIARKYNSTMRTIARANDVSNMDVLRAGQVLVVPSLPGGFSKITAVITNVSEPVTTPPSLGFASSMLGLAKFAVPVLLLAPLLGFCVRCIVDKIRSRAEEEVQDRLAESVSWDSLHTRQLNGWKGRLGEEPLALALASGGIQEEELEQDEGDLYKSYAELEATYTKFLVDSGLAESSGYRDRGSSEHKFGSKHLLGVSL